MLGCHKKRNNDSFKETVIIDNPEPPQQPVPEPGTMILMGGGIAVMSILRTLKRRGPKE